MLLPGAVPGDERHVGVLAGHPVLPQQLHEVLLENLLPERLRALHTILVLGDGVRRQVHLAMGLIRFFEY